MTSAPKSDRITAALGPAIKLASSTTFNPVKMFSLILFSSFFNESGCGCFSLLSTTKLWSAFFKEGRCAFFLVFGSGANSEERSLHRQAFVLAGFQSPIYRFKREFNASGSIGVNLVQN